MFRQSICNTMYPGQQHQGGGSRRPGLRVAVQVAFWCSSKVETGTPDRNSKQLVIGNSETKETSLATPCVGPADKREAGGPGCDSRCLSGFDQGLGSHQAS